jgi:hypothetical protein
VGYKPAAAEAEDDRIEEKTNKSKIAKKTVKNAYDC